MTLFTDVTPLQIALALVSVGVIEEILCRFAPEKMVGPEGWLLRRDLA